MFMVYLCHFEYEASLLTPRGSVQDPFCAACMDSGQCSLFIIRMREEIELGRTPYFRKYMIIMLFKGTSSLFFYYLIFGIIHGDPAWEGRLGIPGHNCQLERLQQGAGTGKGDEATRARWHVHMTTATSLPGVSTQGTAHLGGRKG